MDVGGTNLRAVDSASGGRPSWSPDGRRLALQEADDGGIEIYDLRTGQTQRSLDNLTNADPREPAWAPDGGRFALS